MAAQARTKSPDAPTPAAAAARSTPIDLTLRPSAAPAAADPLSFAPSSQAPQLAATRAPGSQPLETEPVGEPVADASAAASAAAIELDRITRWIAETRNNVGSSRVDLQACKLEYSIVSPK